MFTLREGNFWFEWDSNSTIWNKQKHSSLNAPFSSEEKVAIICTVGISENQEYKFVGHFQKSGKYAYHSDFDFCNYIYFHGELRDHPYLMTYLMT